MMTLVAQSMNQVTQGRPYSFSTSIWTGTHLWSPSQAALRFSPGRWR